MKFRWLTVLVPVFLFLSCKKNNDSDYYVKLKINGNWVTWTTVAGELGPDLGNSTKTDFGVTANDDSQQNVFDFTIQIDGSNFNTGTYTSDNPSYLMVVDYLKDANTPNMKLYQIADATGRPSSKYTINVTSITSTELRGNFTGNYLTEINTDQTIDITEGEFKVRRIR